MKLFVILSRVPYPLEKGDKLRAYHQLRALAKKHEVFLCCLSDEKPSAESIEHLKTFIQKVEVIQLNKWSIGMRLFLGLFSQRPFQVHYFFQRKALGKINRFLNQFQPNHIYCQLIRCTEYVKNYHHCPKTLDYMDALSAGHRRRIASARFPMNWLLREESKRLTTYENLIFDYFENHTIISQQDRDLIYHEKRQQITIVPNGVDSDFFKTKNIEKSYDIVFTGNMNYPPNVSGAIILVKEVMPLIEKSFGKVRVLIAGSSPAPEVKALGEIEGVTVTGWVDDIRDSYDQSKVFVALMRIGSGMQNKILEAMSMQLPCVTTSLAGNAFTKEQKQHLFISDQIETLAQDIITLLKDESKRKSAGLQSREIILEHFNWGATVDSLELTMQKA